MNAQLTPRGARGLTARDVADFEASLTRVQQVLGRFYGSLSARERVVLALGLRASHWEEALAAGDMGRAADHQRAIVKLAQQLTQTAP